MPNIARWGMLLLGAAICFGLGACGGGTKDENVVVRVGENALTASDVEHWIRIEAVTSHGGGTVEPPKGVLPVPPEYVDCIGYLVSHPLGASKPTPSEARVKCATEYKALKEAILSILINDYWVAEEGAAKGVRVSEAEITHYLKQLYPHPGEFARHLKITHERLADDRLLVRGKLMVGKLLALNSRNSRSQAERASAFIKNLQEETARWKPRTSCKPGYVVPQCKEYRGPSA